MGQTLWMGCATIDDGGTAPAGAEGGGKKLGGAEFWSAAFLAKARVWVIVHGDEDVVAIAAPSA
ncbi:hypothetical protein [Mesorhizobium sp. M0571]|uniref:hypothetical protein n=1 Tax=Mesorhizobium sp. M0571 TaxID=2956960 RepID=UPI0033355673